MLDWFLSLNLTYQLILAFFGGMTFDAFILVVILYNKSKELEAYKRQLEKQSIFSDESSSKVKVLEQKIEVLEKALENALKG